MVVKLTEKQMLKKEKKSKSKNPNKVDAEKDEADGGEADGEADAEDGGEGEEDAPVEEEVNRVVQSEIEAVKRLEMGPSAAELARRKLIELDEDVLEERIERLNKIGLQVISSLTGLSKEERLRQLKSCRSFLIPLWKKSAEASAKSKGDDEEDEYNEDVELGEFIENCLEKQITRMFGNIDNDEIPIDPFGYLEQDTFSDEEEEKEREKDKGMLLKKQQEEKEKEEVIYFSDSEDSEDGDEQAEEAVVVEEKVVEIKQVETTTYTSPSRNIFSALVDPNNNSFLRRKLLAPEIAKNSRAALLISLRKKVHQAAKEQYCTQKKIRTTDLNLRLEVSEKCR